MLFRSTYDCIQINYSEEYVYYFYNTPIQYSYIRSYYYLAEDIGIVAIITSLEDSNPIPNDFNIANTFARLYDSSKIVGLVGDKGEPSPRLKDITVDDPMGVFEELLEILAVCWQSCDLAHSDFSEYNILWYDGQPWIIDVGQAVVSAHPSSNEFLVRDVTRLVQWINRQGYEVQLADSLLRVLEEPVPEYPPLPGGD